MGTTGPVERVVIKKVFFHSLVFMPTLNMTDKKLRQELTPLSKFYYLTKIPRDGNKFHLTCLLACIRIRTCLHGGGGPLVGEVTRLGGVTRLSI